MDLHDTNLEEHDAVFEHYYGCFPVSSIKRPSLETGDKVIMPPSALDRLDDGKYVPTRGDLVVLRSKSLVKGTFVKLQPHTKDFLDISNPKAMLETSLRSYSCLTIGDTIMIPYNNKKYYINVVETKPSSAISIIETDCEVDFTLPLDYKEPEKKLSSALSDRERPEAEDEPETKTARVVPFNGTGRRLDGKASTESVEQTSSTMPKQQQTKNENRSAKRTCGKLVFGSNANTPKIQTPPKASPTSPSQDSSQKEEKPNFQAFTGKKYSLKCC